MDVSWTLWALTIFGLSALIAVDFFIGRKPHDVSTKEAGIWTVVWIALAILFGLGLMVFGESQASGEFFAGFITEKSLSVDNLFVFVLIMAKFSVPSHLQQRVLLIGVLIALVLRAIFIAAARGPGAAGLVGQGGGGDLRVAGEAVGEEDDLPLREPLRQVLQLVADVQVDVVDLQLDQPAERDPGRGVRHAVAQGDRTGPVGRFGRHRVEAARARLEVGQLLGQGARGAGGDVGVPGFAARVHRETPENISERVGVT
ncbi:hypothetical protein SMICM17S_10609 [Streptomyces microflavus]